MKTHIKALIAAGVFALSANVIAQTTPGDAATAMSSGEVRKIDKNMGKMTIKHGPLVNLGMDAMTMVFRVRAPAMLDQVSVGDRVRFVAEQPNGQLTVTRIEKEK